MSTTARRYWLKALRLMGVKQFRATSGLGLPYLCHVGDFAGEVPFYDRSYSVLEIAIMAAWCESFDKPVIFDIGANNGFVASQLAQILRHRHPTIFAFEPVPSTYAMLDETVRALNLQDCIFPISCGIADRAGIRKIAYDKRATIFAQIRSDTLNARAGTTLVSCPLLTTSEVARSLEVSPVLLKIDVEGFELQVLRGGHGVLSVDQPPAVFLEWNPITMAELNNAPADLLRILNDYVYVYIDDFEGQRMPFGQLVASLQEIDWVCNIFCVPAASANQVSSIVAHSKRLCGPTA